MRRVGMIAVALAVLLQAFGAASMPVMSVSQDGEMLVICTGSGMKVVPLADLGLELEVEQGYPEAMFSDGMCAFCVAAHTVAISPSLVYIPAIDLDAHAPQAPSPERPVVDAFRPLPQGRAPPFNV